jgi:hypothetical protein
MFIMCPLDYTEEDGDDHGYYEDATPPRFSGVFF